MKFEVEFLDGHIEEVEDYLVTKLDGIEYAICMTEPKEGEVKVTSFYVTKDENGYDQLTEITNPIHALRVWQWVIDELEKDRQEEQNMQEEWLEEKGERFY